MKAVDTGPAGMFGPNKGLDKNTETTRSASAQVSHLAENASLFTFGALVEDNCLVNRCKLIHCENDTWRIV